jgi:hypothetical protein
MCRTDPGSAALIEAAVDLLAEHGPNLGRPLVDRLKGSRFHNMKELRPGSTGRSEMQLISAFDPRREALVLVGGDKAGAWKSWYRTAVPPADQRYAEHLTAHAESEGR